MATISAGSTGRSAGTPPIASLRADDAAALHAAAGEVHRPALRPVVAAAGRVDPRRAAELGQVADQRVVQHAALVEVFDQRAVGLVVHRGDDVLHALDRRERLRAVDVPGDLVEHGEERVDRDEPHAGLDQPPGEQAALAEAVHAVALADLRAAPCDRSNASRACGLVIRRKAASKLLSSSLALSLASKFLTVSSTIVAQLAAAVEPGLADLRRRQQVGHLEVRLRRIGHQRERVVRLAEEAGVLAVRQVAAGAAHRLGQDHVRRADRCVRPRR